MFLVISTICTNQNPLDYHPTRSVFTPQQRLEQTIESIKSIRKYTNHRVVHVECSNYAEMGLSLDPIRDAVDVFIDLSKNPEVIGAANSPHKSWAELLSVRAALSLLPPSDETMFKLSGRYCLNESFDISKFGIGDVTAKVYRIYGPTRCCSVLYSVTNASRYADMCEYCYHNFSDRKWTSMEEMLYLWASRNSLHEIDSLGCRGKIAVTGEEWTA